jgi:myosin heavy subunit
VLQATNADYANRLYQSPLAKESKRFSKPKLSQTAFTIEHYAGGVSGCIVSPAI